MTLRSARKLIATTLCLLAATTAAAGVKQHIRTPDEYWDFEVTIKAASWSVETGFGSPFLLSFPGIDPYCVGKNIRLPSETGTSPELFNIFLTARSLDAEIRVKYVKGRRTVWDQASRKWSGICKIHSVAIDGNPLTPTD